MIGDDWIADALGGRDFGMDTIFFDVYKEDKKETGLKAITHLQQIKEYL
jgi:putative hydrolase of the HAD superfamily